MKKICRYGCLCILVLPIFIMCAIWKTGCFPVNVANLATLPDILVGEWASSDSKEYLNIKYIESVDMQSNAEFYYNKFTKSFRKAKVPYIVKWTEHRYDVFAKGQRMFSVNGDAENNIVPCQIIMEGTFIVKIEEDKSSNLDVFQIKWREGKKGATTFGMFRKSTWQNVSLYTYITDPDHPDSMIRLYKR